MKTAIKSSHIYPDPFSPPISGYILINDEYIEDILPLSSISADLLLNYIVIDYEDLYIMPGLIDINVHLNANFEPEWLDYENITKQALIGGVTTIIDNPIMNHREGRNLDEISNIHERQSALQDKIYTDCGLLAYLGSYNYMEFHKIYIQTGVLGFKLYMSQSFESNLPILEPKEFQNIAYFFKNEDFTKLSEEMVISINAEMASNRDLFMASPCRNCPMHSRLDLTYDIHNFSGFGGGHHGIFCNEDDDEEDQNRRKSRSLCTKPNAMDDNVIELINDIQHLETTNKDIHNLSPSTALLNLNSRLLSNILEQKHISDLELLDYEDSSVTLKNSKNNAVEFDFQDHDSNLAEDINPMDSLNEDKLSIEAGFKGDGGDLSENQNSSPMIPDISVVVSRQPKRFDSCPFLKDHEFNLKNTLDEAFEEIKQVENSDLGNSDKSHESIGSSKLSGSSFGERRKTFIDKNKKTAASKFKEIALIKTKKSVHHEKEKKKNGNYMYFLPNHPVSWETNGVNFILKVFKNAINPLKKVILTNLSSPSLGFQVREAKKICPELQIYTDTSSPFIFFNKDNIGFSETKYKCSPPIRDKENQYFLVRSVKALIFDSVSSYHISVPEHYKTIDGGNFRRALNGISSIGGSLSMLWTKLFSILRIKEKKLGITDKNIYKADIERLIKKVILLMSYNPSKLMFLEKKGCLVKGNHADLVVWDPFKIKHFTKKFEDLVIKEKKMYCLKDIKVYGEVMMTMLRGEVVFERKNIEELSFGKKKGRLMYNKSFVDKK